MAHSDSPLADADDEPLSQIVGDNHVGELLEDGDQQVSDVQQYLLEALEILGPKTMDDPTKYSVVRQLLGVLRVLELENGTVDSQAIPDDYLIDSRSEAGRGPHYNPLAEVSELEEPTYEALAERYSAMEALTGFSGEETATGSQMDVALNVQVNLGGALIELAEAHFAGKDAVEQLILGAMAIIDRTHPRETYLSTEVVTVSETVRDGGPEIEYDTTDLSVALK